MEERQDRSVHKRRQEERYQRVEALRRLFSNPDFQIYKEIIDKQKEMVAKSLKRLLKDERDVAVHNMEVGRLEGLSFASDLQRMVEYLDRYFQKEQ